mgnify:CR=1 FL=1
MVKLQVKDEKVKYEYPDVEGQNADLKIKYAIANELAELNRNLGMIKISLMSISSTQDKAYYRRS